MLQQASQLNLNVDLNNFLPNTKTFRIIASDENEFVSVDKKLLAQVESKIICLKGTKLRVDPHRPQAEFWFLRRSENIGFFMLRLTKNITNKKLPAGELRPELAYILCYLSEPDKSDIFLDPFAGHGSIPIERAKNFSYNMIFASDNDKNFKQIIRDRIKTKKVNKTIIPKVLDALDMKVFENGFVSKIVTDPPWGLYENIKDITAFYTSMMKEFVRVLKTGGIIVLLTAKKDEYEKVISKHSDLDLLEKYEILVSGKKSAIYKIKKK
jgi:23S rRNA G2445 N2-methylase RlmL